MDSIKGRIAAFLTMFFVAAALLLLFQGPAFAHHREDHGGGPPHERSDDASEGSEEETDSEESSTSEDASTSEEASDEERRSSADESAGDGSAGDADDEDEGSTRSERRVQTVSDRSVSQPSSPGGSDGKYECSDSHHSDSGTGANQGTTDNPYASTCDGSPSQNGSGNGNATGRPCAGCVGNADDKFPPGQAPNGSDANNGYECDGNNGIGKTNPAHTGCKSPPPVSPCDADGNPANGIQPCVPPEPPPCDKDNNPANGIQPCVPDEPKPKPPKVDRVLPKPPLRRPPVLVRDVTFPKEPRAQLLPRTGADATAFGAGGLGLVVAGGSLMLLAARFQRKGRRKA